MYKVFIENKPIFFHFNSQSSPDFALETIWEMIHLFLKNDQERLEIELSNEAEFDQVFALHKYIEAAGGMVRKADAYLFILRNGVWDIPKGKLEKGETPELAAVREIEEECGLVEPIIVSNLINTLHTYPHKGKQVLKRTYWYLLDEDEKNSNLIPQIEEGITELEYVKLEDFDKIKKNTYGSIIDVMDALKNKL